jgi:hypothetical protein
MPHRLDHPVLDDAPSRPALITVLDLERISERESWTWPVPRRRWRLLDQPCEAAP